MAVGVIADVSNNEGVKFDVDESFIGTPFFVGSAYSRQQAGVPR